MSEELQTLVAQGIIRALPERPFNVADGNYITRDLQSIFHSINESWNDTWALAPPKEFRADWESENINSVALIMRDILPSPTANVSVSEILSFRSLNEGLLRDFHFGVDTIFASLGGNLELAARQLQQTIDEIESQFVKAKFPYFKVGMSASQTISEHLIAPVLEVIAQRFGLPPGIGALFDGMFEIHLRKSANSMKSNSYPKDFEYIYLSRQNLVTNEHMLRSSTGKRLVGVNFTKNNRFIMGHYNDIVEEIDLDFNIFRPGITIRNSGF